MIIYQQAQEVEFLIKLFSGATPETGLILDDLTVLKWAPGDTQFLPISDVDMELTELTNGDYALKISNSELWAAFGEHILRISGAFDDIERPIDVIAPPLNAFSQPDRCIVSGNIVDVGGEPGRGQNIFFGPVNFPVKSGQSLVSSDKVATVPDALGNFSVSLIRNQTVVIEIERTGIRNQFTVPDQDTALLLDLLPPIS